MVLLPSLSKKLQNHLRLFIFNCVLYTNDILFLNDKTDISSIVALAAKNNRIAQMELFNLYHRQMLGLCVRMVERVDIAEDILQESFIKAFSQLKKLKEPKKFNGWFKRIVINQCVSYIRVTKNFEPIEEAIEGISDEDENDWYNTFSLEYINTEIDSLPQGCKQIFVLYLLEDYKHQQIAEMLNISVSTVKSQYQYALRLLREKLKVKLDEPIRKIYKG